MLKQKISKFGRINEKYEEAWHDVFSPLGKYEATYVILDLKRRDWVKIKHEIFDKTSNFVIELLGLYHMGVNKIIFNTIA